MLPCSPRVPGCARCAWHGVYPLRSRSRRHSLPGGLRRADQQVELSLDLAEEFRVEDARGRRVFPASPENSLLLQKSTGKIPHGGGRRLDPAGAEYKTLLAWIANP